MNELAVGNDMLDLEDAIIRAIHTVLFQFESRGCAQPAQAFSFHGFCLGRS